MGFMSENDLVMRMFEQGHCTSDEFARYLADGFGIGGMRLCVSTSEDGLAAAEENPTGEHEPGALCFGCDAAATPGYWLNEYPVCMACIMQTAQYLGMDLFGGRTFETYRSGGAPAPWSWRYK